jgi:hypothetical protein
MLGFLESLTGLFMANIIGGPDGTSLMVATLFLITILVAILLAARLELELALVIVSPAIIIASFAGLIPPVGLGIAIVLLALFWAGIILAIIR